METRRDEPPLVPPFVPVVVGLLFAFRFIALPLLIAGVLFARRDGRRSRRVRVLWAAFFLALLSPVDIPVLGSYRSGGAHRSGPRFVRCVVGLPAHTALIRRYGEYYSLGCSAYTGYFPLWMFVPY